MKNLAIIPARGGSKRLPKKNIKLLNGKPLIQYTLDAVKNSGVFDEIILSSDDDEILNIGATIDGITPAKRDSKFAGDKVKVIDLIQFIANKPEIQEEFDTIGLFLPTCPFRTSKHIQEGFKLLTPNDFSVVSVTEMQEPVQLTVSIDNNDIMNPEAIMKPSPLVTGNTRSQDFETIFRVNGGFYIAWIKKFIKKENYFQGQVKAYKMPPLNSVDIDYQLDFDWAEHLLKNGHIEL